jgi:uncharacterized protein DUF222
MDVVSEAVGVIGEQIAVLSKACDELSHRELIGLSAELTKMLRTVPALEHRVLARLLDETEPCRLGEKTWSAVLTTALRISSAEAKRRIARAQVLGPRRAMTGEPLAPLWESTAAAQAQGLLDVEHVAVIVKFHNALPSWVDVGTRAQADRHLARIGSGLGPEELAAAAAMLLIMINPDGAEPSERERARKRGIVIGKQRPDGTATINGVLTPEALAIWEAVFAKEAAPGHNNPDDQNDPDGQPGPGAADGQSGAGAADGQPGAAADANPGVSEAATDGKPDADAPSADTSSKSGRKTCRDTRSAAQRNHDAFVAVGRRLLESGNFGSHNGLPVTVIVSTTLQELETGAGVAVTGGGSLLPMPDLIRLAANAHHYLYVYDEHTGQSLYLARTKRLANAAQRIVLHARDRGCTRPGCTAPGYWCQAHHAVADFSDGGETNVDDMSLACPGDHRMLDNTEWSTRKNTTNQTEWLPPPDLDTGQNRVNGYHHPERYLLRDEEDEDEDP